MISHELNHTIQTIQGSIPDDITYIYPKAYACDTFFYNSCVATQSFVSDSANKKTIQNGVEWAKGKTKNGEVWLVSKNNKPVSGYIICDLEKRNEGGRAYKVASPDGFLFDLREDILFDILINCGILPGGVIPCPMIWAMVKSQMKLVRKDSELCKALEKSSEIGKKDKLTEFNIGTIYRGKSADYYLYLGKGDVDIFKYGERDWTAFLLSNEIHTEHNTILNSDLWLEIPFYLQNDIKHNLDTVFKEIKESTFSHHGLKIIKKNSLTEEVGTYSVPSDVVTQLSINSIRKLREAKSRGVDYLLTTFVRPVSIPFQNMPGMEKSDWDTIVKRMDESKVTPVVKKG